MLTRAALAALAALAAVAALALAPVAATPLAAQEEGAKPPPEFCRKVEGAELCLGALLQVDYVAREGGDESGRSGFTIATFRLRLLGELRGGFSYFLQTSFTDSPVILDGFISSQLGPRLRLSAGQFRVPFTGELQIPAQNTDFINRSRAVQVLAPGREIGAQLAMDLAPGRLRGIVGAFNGNGFAANQNDGHGVLLTSRLVARPALPRAQRLELAVNAATSADEDVTRPGGVVTDFRGRRTMFGTDARYTAGRWLLSGELLRLRLSPDSGERALATGWHSTVGHSFDPKVQLLLRWDAVRARGTAADGDLLVTGLNIWPTEVTELQVNLAVPVRRDDLRRHELSINFQVNF